MTYNEPKLKILMIGNSFSEDTIAYIDQIAIMNGYRRDNIKVYTLYIGGCSLERHYQNIIEDNHVYELKEFINGKLIIHPNYSVLQGIELCDFDYISLQQQSAQAGIIDSFTYLHFIFEYVKNHALNKKVKILWNMTWSYAHDFISKDFQNFFNSNSHLMYKSIIDCVEKVVLKEDFDSVIPVGRAIEEAKKYFDEKTIYRDGFHLSLTIGRIIAGLTLFMVTTNINIDEIKFHFDILSENEHQIIIDCIKKALSNNFS